jgi:hypothetical protein
MYQGAASAVLTKASKSGLAQSFPILSRLAGCGFFASPYRKAADFEGHEVCATLLGYILSALRTSLPNALMHFRGCHGKSVWRIPGSRGVYSDPDPAVPWLLYNLSFL